MHSYITKEKKIFNRALLFAELITADNEEHIVISILALPRKGQLSILSYAGLRTISLFYTDSK